MVPPSYNAFSSDLHVQLQSEFGTFQKSQEMRLHVTRLDDNKRTVVGSVDVYPDPRTNTTQITLPCQFFLRGGIHELEIIGNDLNSTIDNYDERLRQQLDVRWPIPILSLTPESIGTYPQSPVDAILRFPGVECSLPDDQSTDLPEFWLELLYCGHNVYCDSSNVTQSQILYAEQVRGFPKTRIIKLRCELFGLAGHYVFKLRPTTSIPSAVSASAYIKVNKR